VELKEYQHRTLERVKEYLGLLADWRAKALDNPELEVDYPRKAWEKMRTGRAYRGRTNGMGEPLPTFCLKVPTGGGKTLLAVRCVDLINTAYRRRKTGLVLWVVPTTQIYSQTIRNLRDREHPYRQQLDIASGGRTVIKEKGDVFSPMEVEGNLVVLMLMLPSASRQNKETLRLFRDSGGFGAFFPAEDDVAGNQALLERVRNLDTFERASAFWGRQIKTSLGNTLRLLNPLLILDEGHKAYSETAQGTLRGFNPSIIVELSATPTDGSNVLVDIKGMDLNREEMIKLDLHIHNKASQEWKDTLLSSIEKREELEAKAREYEANTGVHIRPICVIQVERTGKDQRKANYIHSEDVREYLTRVRGIPAEEVAVKTSQTDELKEVDDVGGLMARDCRIRYIITKQALQEGWDCAFAYVLAVLTNPSSKTALTQLVGRILRQPYAKKTGLKALDESYVFCFRQRAEGLMNDIRKGFGHEGLGDLTGRIAVDEDAEEGLFDQGMREIEVREHLRHAAGQVILPVFVTRDGDGWRAVNYEMDIAGQIAWAQADVTPVTDLPLSFIREKDTETLATLSDDEKELVRERAVMTKSEGGLSIDCVFVARHLADVVPNPWVAYEMGKRVIAALLTRYDEDLVANNFVYIVEELRKQAMRERDRLAEGVFRDALKADRFRFWVIGEKIERLPTKRKVRRGAERLNKRDGGPLERSLFEFVAKDDFNDLEKQVAWYLEDQDRLLFWYRSIARQDYFVQGWRRHRIYADFILADHDGDGEDLRRVYVIETKGLHLKSADDTAYKRSMFEVCNEQSRQTSWTELGIGLDLKRAVFEVIDEDEWQAKVNELLAG